MDAVENTRTCYAGFVPATLLPCNKKQSTMSMEAGDESGATDTEATEPPIGVVRTTGREVTEPPIGVVKDTCAEVTEVTETTINETTQ